MEEKKFEIENKEYEKILKNNPGDILLNAFISLEEAGNENKNEKE